MAPFCGAVLGALKIPGFTAVVSGALALYGWPYLAANSARPLLGQASVFLTKRDTQYFIQNGELKRPYSQAVLFLKQQNCHRIGLQTGGNDFQYPFWPLAEKAGIPDATFVSVNVCNCSRALAAAFIPEAVVVTDGFPDSGLCIHNVPYHRAFQNGGVSVFLKD